MRKVLLSLLLVAMSLFAETSSEYTLKAAFIERFTRFVDWPQPIEEGFAIGIVGKGHSFKTFKKLFAKQQIKSKPVTVVHIKDKINLSSVDILFIEEESSWSLREICEEVKSLPVLTISNDEKGAYQGLIIAFVQDGKRLKFRINLQASKDAKLEISSFLLEMAEIVNTKQEEAHR